ncbi:KR domain-containing protein [Nonomuraea sp. NPDC055795]
MDVRLPGDGADWPRLVSQLMAELTGPARDDLAAYRGPWRWSRAFAPVELPAAEEGWRAGAGYLVTGACGEGGLIFAEQMAAAGARLVLVGREDFPARQDWDTGDERFRPHLDRLLALERAGPGEVTFLTADLSDPGQARHVVETARRRLGSIDGVLHAVDVRGSGMTALKTPQESAAVLAARVTSTLLLDDLLAGDDLGFFLLASSTTGVVGGFGQLENCAAATFLDAFAHARAARGLPAISLDWGQWAWDDWHERQARGLPETRERFARHRREHGIPVKEGTALARRALAVGLPQVVISPLDFQEAVAGRAALTPLAFTEAPAPGAAGWDPATVWPDDGVARDVAATWRDVLGVTDFGPEDDFFDLGGNSLSAIQIVSRLRQSYGDLPMSAVFETPTVPGVAAAIRARQVESIALHELEALLAEIEGLSPEEARARVAEEEREVADE